MPHDKLEHQIHIEQILMLFHVQLLILSVILIYLINLYGIFKLIVTGKNQWELGIHLSYALENPLFEYLLE